MIEKSSYARLAALDSRQSNRLVEALRSASSQLSSEPIAVLGVACRLPGNVHGIADFDRLLAEGRTPISPAEPRRWIGDPYGVRAGFISGLDRFDANFFGLTPREVESLDPQQRLALESAIEAIEDSGRTVDDLRGSTTGVFLGIYHHDFGEALGSESTPYSASGNAHSVAAGRLAYTLDLSGPAISFDTACSTSLVAIHQAARSLSMRECDGAIVVGVNVILSRHTHDSLDSWGMLSPRARCSPFDAAADGFVRGEGVGSVYLKRLSDAIRDGDEVLAVIRGSAVNQDGRSQGLTAPRGAAQVAVIEQALENAGIPSTSVGYIETHGTGTALGDPIEYEALHEVYGKPATTGEPCILGAVKSNIGHLEAAAGIVGFIKAVMVVGSGRIPRNPGFDRLNPHIGERPTRLRVAENAVEWQTDRPRRAAVSAFGFSGTNAHVVLEEGSRTAAWPRPAPRTWNHEKSWPLPMSDSRATPDGWFLVPDLVELPALAGAPRAVTIEVLSATGNSAEALAEALRARGAEVTSGRIDSWRPGETQVTIVMPETGRDLTDLDGLRDEAAELAGLATRLEKLPGHQMVIATHSAHPRFNTAVDPIASSWWGWARACALEMGATFGGAVDADTDETLAEGLLTHLTAKDGELFTVMDAGRRLVPRLLPAPDSVTQLAPEELDDEHSYLIVGANGPVGLALADHLVARGAVHLTLTGRGEPSEELVQRMTALNEQGADLRWVQAHADDFDQMRHVIDAFGADRPPLTGVFLTAFAGRQIDMAELTASDIDEMYRPKVNAAVYLDELTADLDLSIFALFSSTTGCLGSKQLAHYSGASAFLDGLAHRRRQRGLPALAIDWGIWAGRLEETTDHERHHVEGSGLRAMDDRLAIHALDQLLSQPDKAQVMVADADWELLRTAYSTQTSFTLVDDLLCPPTEHTKEAQGAATLAATAPRDRERAVVAWVQQVVANCIHLNDPGQLPVDKGFFDLGIDSLMGVQIQRTLSNDFGIELSPTAVYSHPTVTALAAHIRELTQPVEKTAPADASTTPSTAPEDPIAIVGMACRFPRGETIDEFWTTLSTGRDAISHVPSQRWDADSFSDPDPTALGTIRTDRGGFLTRWDPAQFDAEFFGISPREAAAMDPQQRLMLELSIETLNDAGLPPLGLQGTRTGTFIGITTHDYMTLQIRANSPEDVDAYTGTGIAANFAAGRVSYHLRLQGPAMAVDTACSSSLTALHLALGELRSGTCDAALVGGVNLMLVPDTSVSFTRWGMLSPRGFCASFDDSADGFVRGEGGGMIMLKPLSAALRDGDRVVAVLRGSSCGQDGESAGQTVPNGAAQSAVISDALARSGLTPDDIDFVETHGAGTAVGDPIELEALGEVFGDRKDPIILGALKSVTGHMEAAAGIGGIIKTALAISHRQIPPNLHFQKLTSQVTPRASHVEVPSVLTSWPATAGRPARAGVSSFGASGTNVHIIIESGPANASSNGVWLFSGQGSQWDGMGNNLLETSPAFAKAVADLTPHFERETGCSLRPLLTGEAPLEGIELVQPAIFCMQVALAETWRSLGAQPTAVIGHSMGEVAAAVVAGALDIADGMAIIARRSKLLSTISGNGLMAMLEATETTAREVVRKHPDVDIAVLSAPEQTVLSGTPEAIRAITKEFQDRGLFAREIAVDVASHSPQVDRLLPTLRKVLKGITPHEPDVPFLSTVSGQPTFDPDYWADNLRRPVQLMGSLERAFADGEKQFVEMAPHPLLGASVLDCAAGREVTFVPSMRRHDPSIRPNPRSTRSPVTWNRKRHWFEATVRDTGDFSLLGQHGVTPSGEHVFTRRDLLGSAPWLSDHQVNGITVMPLAAWVAMIVEAVDTIKHEPTSVRISNLELHSMLALGESTDVTTSLEPAGADTWRVRIGSLSPSWRLHASAQVTVVPPTDMSKADSDWNGPGIWKDFPVTRLYERLRSVGQQHSGVFTPVADAALGSDGTATAHLRITSHRAAGRRMRIFPPLLDGALQTLAVPSPAEATDTVLPERIGSIHVTGRFGNDATAQARIIQDDDGRATGAVRMTTEKGWVDISGIILRRLDAPASPEVPLFDQCWTDLPDVSEQPGSTRVHIVSSGETSTQLADQLEATFGTSAVEIASTSDPAGLPEAVCVVVDSTTDLDVVGVLMAIQRATTRILGWKLRDTPRLYCLVKVPATGTEQPAEAALRAFCRVLAYEHPDLRASVVSFDALEEAAVVSHVQADSPERDVALVGGTTRTCRLQQVQPMPRELILPVGVSTVARAEVQNGSMTWVEVPNPPLDKNEVLIQVEAAGLNFSDVLKRRGSYPLRPGETSILGGELVGTVIACGSQTEFSPGERVFGLATGTFGTTIRARAELLSRVPDGLSITDAATLPTAYATALHCLDNIARLGAGETILVTSASGGVGLAAITFARHLGARTIVTAGTRTKRSYLRSLGFEDVLDSRAPDLAERVKKLTGGVDVVLNTLTGTAFHQLLSVLRPEGRFVELSKNATFGHGTLNLAALARGGSFSAVDLAYLMHHDIGAARRLLTEVVDGVADGWVTPLPTRSFELSRLDDALAAFSDQDHHGKIIVTGATNIEAQPPANRVVRPSGSYIVTGAFSGLGWVTTSWLAAQMPRRLVLNGRNGPDKACAATIEQWKTDGLEIDIVLGDVTEAETIAELVGHARKAGPLRGVIHSAGVVRDQTIRAIDEDTMRSVFRPKVDAARLLLDAIADDDLDFCVLFSSAAALLGSPGQGSYAAANAAMEALALQRAERGCPVKVISWGPWAETGLATSFSTLGYHALTNAEGLGALERIIRSSLQRTGVFHMDARQWFQSYPVVSELPYFSELEIDPDTSKSDVLLLAGATTDAEARDRVHGLVVRELGAVLRCDPCTIDPQAPFASFGLDSLMALELRNRLEHSGCVRLPVTLIWSSPTVEQLTDALLRVLRGDLLRESAEESTSPVISDEDAQWITNLGKALRDGEEERA